MAQAVTPLPKLATPQAYAAFFNAHVNKGKPVAGVPFAGKTVGDQWLAFYADRHAKFGSKYDLFAYATAFLADVTGALVNTDLQAGISGGAQKAAELGQGAAQGGLSLYQNSLLGFLGRLSDPHLWYRAGCVIGGAWLLYLGLNRMTGGKIGQAVRGTTTTAAKAAII